MRLERLSQLGPHSSEGEFYSKCSGTPLGELKHVSQNCNYVNGILLLPNFSESWRWENSSLASV